MDVETLVIAGPVLVASPLGSWVGSLQLVFALLAVVPLCFLLVDQFVVSGLVVPWTYWLALLKKRGLLHC